MTTLQSIMSSLHTLVGHKRKECENLYSDNTYWLYQQCNTLHNNINNDKYNIIFDIQPIQHDYKRKRKSAVHDSIPPYIESTQNIMSDSNDQQILVTNDIPKPKKGKTKTGSKNSTLVDSIELPGTIELHSTDIIHNNKKTRGGNNKHTAAPVAVATAVEIERIEKPVRATRAAKKAAITEDTPTSTVQSINELSDEVVMDEPAAKKNKKVAAGKKGGKKGKNDDNTMSSDTTTSMEPVIVNTTTESFPPLPLIDTPIATYDDSMNIMNDNNNNQNSIDEVVVEPTVECIQPASARTSIRLSASSAQCTTAINDSTPKSLSATLSTSVDSDDEMNNTTISDTNDDTQTVASTASASSTPLLSSMQSTYDTINKSTTTSSSTNSSLTKPLPSSVMSVSAVSLASSMLHAHNNNNNNSSIVRPSVPGVNLSAMSTVKVPLIQHKSQPSITVPLTQINNNNATSNMVPVSGVTTHSRTSVSSSDIKLKRLSQQKVDATKAAETAAIKYKYELSKQLHESNVAETKRMKSRSNSNTTHQMNDMSMLSNDNQPSTSVTDVEMTIDDINTSTPSLPIPSINSTTHAITNKPQHVKQSSTELSSSQPSTIKPLVKSSVGTVLDVTQIRAQKELLAQQHKNKQLIAESRRKQLEEENKKMQQMKDAERNKREEDAAKNRAALLKQKTQLNNDKQYNISSTAQQISNVKSISTVKPLVRSINSTSSDVQQCMAPPSSVKPILHTLTNTTINAKPITSAAVQLQSANSMQTPSKPSLVMGNQSLVSQAAVQQTPNSLVKSATKNSLFSFSPAGKPIANTPMKSVVKAGDVDNYDMSDHSGSDSDDDSKQSSRGKRIPTWARDPLLSAELKLQIDIDPDTIFPLLPDTCDLSVIFKSFRANERFRKRYSSGNWTGDTLTRIDEITYKKHMGYSTTHPHATL